jgi:16S rRNA U516 pseudouridylate synthase RsuA-like enzyme
MEHLGLKVNRLIRVSFGQFNLKELGIAEIKELNKTIVKNIIPLQF